MESYFHSGPLQSPGPQASRSTGTTLAHTVRILQPYPSSNDKFECNEFNTPEGIYNLAQETFLPKVHPQFTVGTMATVANMRPSNSSLGLSVSSTKNSSTASSMNDTANTPASLFDKPHDTHTTGSSDDDHSNALLGARNYHPSSSTVLSSKAAALPIPNTSTNLKSPRIASSSSSGDRGSLAVITSYTSNATNGGHVYGSNGTHSTYSTNGTGYSGSLTPTSSTQYVTTSYHASIPDASGVPSTPSVSVENVREDTGGTATPTSVQSSVGSLSSLFSRNSIRHPKKPKNNLAKTNSSFVENTIKHERLGKILASRTGDETFLFYNVGTSFVWMDGYARRKYTEPLTRVVFSKATPTCHDLNTTSQSTDHLDVIIGFSTGDCVWYDPISGTYFRLNKGGVMNGSPVTMIKWIPGSKVRFMASFKDGTVLIMDKERDDQPFVAPPPESWTDQHFQVFKPQKNAKHNPVSVWKMSDRSITAFAFSPDGMFVAMVTLDGFLHVIDFSNERLGDIFKSYFGGLRCVTWSPDGRYILTGGEDDLVTIWAFHERAIVARCQGHKSFVTAVAFDPWRCDDKVYRFGSVGEDCRLLLWDFSLSALHRRRHVRPASSAPQSPKTFQSPPQSPRVITRPMTIEQNRKSIPPSMGNITSPPGFSSGQQPLSTQSKNLGRFRRRNTRPIFGHSSPMEDDEPSYGEGPLYIPLPSIHPVPGKDRVPYLQPVMSQVVHADPCVGLQFQEDCILTTDRRGRVRAWGRP